MDFLIRDKEQSANLGVANSDSAASQCATPSEGIGEEVARVSSVSGWQWQWPA